MKEKEFLALKDHEFLEMVETITKERQTLRCKKRDQTSIKIVCHIGIPISFITFITEKRGNNLMVYQKVNWLPLFYSTLPILLLLEVFTFLIKRFIVGDAFGSYYIYILIILAWLLAIGFLIYQTFSERDEIQRKLFRVEV